MRWRAWCLTWSWEQGSWLAQCPSIPWTPVSPEWARKAVDRGYVVIDAV